MTVVTRSMSKNDIECNICFKIKKIGKCNICNFYFCIKCYKEMLKKLKNQNTTISNCYQCKSSENNYIKSLLTKYEYKLLKRYDFICLELIKSIYNIHNLLIVLNDEYKKLK